LREACWYGREIIGQGFVVVTLIARARSWLSQPRITTTSIRNLSVLLFVLFGFAYALFTQDNVSHNTLCRAAMTANMVQYGRVDINGYENLTRDKAAFGGDYYCDKGPGMSLLAAPAAFVFTRVFPVTSETPYNGIWAAFLYLCALTTSGLLTALAGVLIFRHVRARTSNLDAGLIAAFAFAFAEPVWGWATSFFSHSATAALLAMGYVAFDEACRRPEARVRFAILAGLAFGGATATEYTALVAALIIGGALAAAHLKRGWTDMLAALAWTGAGAIVALIPVLIFHAVAFGSPFETGYAHTVEFNLHQSGIVGVNVPQPDILMKLLVSPERGIIWYAPIILPALWAAFRGLRRQDLRATAIATLLVVAFYLLMNAGFGYWHGGASTGPRYLTPAVGFAALVLGLAWPRFSVWERRGTLAILAIGAFIGFACTAVSMTAGTLTADILPNFFAGELRSTLTYVMIERASLVHFLAPVLVGALMAWLIANERKLALTAS